MQNITKAAARRQISQPPLSRQIRDLEKELGVALLQRGAKSLKLTEAGRVFLVEAHAVLARTGQARKAVRAFANQCAGELQVGDAPSLTVELPPPALR
jgi:DNA-binding transcriptional LysR family regulator